MTKVRSRPRNPAAAQKELRSLASSLAVIRILNYIADAPLGAARLRERLSANGRPLDPASLSRTLARLRRQGWLKTKISLHSITPAGRDALKRAISGLKNLAVLTDRQTRKPKPI
jgi:hypothetical protein